ncbi:unnamed protein product [Closterium sp. NIES-65]|nr:unnamed protein product [Closterium sp. NIES-65]
MPHHLPCHVTSHATSPPMPHHLLCHMHSPGIALDLEELRRAASSWPAFLYGSVCPPSLSRLSAAYGPISCFLGASKRTSQLVARLPLRLAIHSRHNAPHGSARAAPAAAAPAALAPSHTLYPSSLSLPPPHPALPAAIHARHNAPHGPARAAPAAAATGATHRCAVRFRLLLVSAACLQPTNLAPSSLPCLAISLSRALLLHAGQHHSRHPFLPIPNLRSPTLLSPFLPSLLSSSPQVSRSSAACLPPSPQASLLHGNTLAPSLSVPPSRPPFKESALWLDGRKPTSFPLTLACLSPCYFSLHFPLFARPFSHQAAHANTALALGLTVVTNTIGILTHHLRANMADAPSQGQHGRCTIPFPLNSPSSTPQSPPLSLPLPFSSSPQLQHPNALPAPSPFPFPALSRPARSSKWGRGNASTPIKARSSKWGRVSTSRATVTRAGYHSPRSSLHWHAVATWADQRKQQLSMANNAMLSFVPWMQVSSARAAILRLDMTQLLPIAAAGIAVHLSFLALNMGVMAALRRITPPLPLQEANAVDRAVIILSSQKTLPVAATVVEKIGTLMGEPALVLLPCILTHFLQGCDASVLLDSTEDNKAEKDSDPNATLGAFDVVDDIKDHLEAECPGVVSCADILALAAREGIHLAGGPFTEVPLGRRDGLTSFALAAETFLPGSTLNVSGLVHNFNTVGLDMTDVVTLSGAHTIGEGRCVSLKNRLEQDDPTMDPEFAAYVKQKCGTSNIDPKAMIENDYASPNKFDNQHQTNLVTHPFLAPSIQHRTIFVRFYVSPPPQYYKNLLAHKGLFTTDQALIYDDKTEKAVKAFAHAKSVWFDAFPKSLVKMGVISPLTGTQGEVRLNCHVRNTY